MPVAGHEGPTGKLCKQILGLDQPIHGDSTGSDDIMDPPSMGATARDTMQPRDRLTVTLVICQLLETY